MAVSLFRATSPAQYVDVATFIAWAYGIELSATQLAGGAALAVVISCGAVGLPVEPLGLLIAVDTISDVFATVGNVTGDLTATTVVARRAAALRANAPLDGLKAEG